MSFTSYLQRVPSHKSNTEWRPTILNPRESKGEQALVRLFENNEVVAICDTIHQQLGELLSSQDPSASLSDAEWEERIAAKVGGNDRELEGRYGTWVYYPWSRRLVHVLPQEEFSFVRLDRNRHKILAEEQVKLQGMRIGVAGLSVGQATALTLAMEGVGGELRLADFDELSLSNLNRLRAGVHNVGVPKCMVAAREIYELNPYAKVELFQDGITDENIDEFLVGNGRLDLLIEECDDLPIKLKLRERARALKLPVLMETSDRGLLDIERFDLEPERPIFHGLIEDVRAQDLKGLSTADKVPYVLKILGEENLSPRMIASLFEVEQTISTWPQLASSIMLGAGCAVDTARRILLGQLTISGRFHVDLAELISDASSEPREELAEGDADVRDLDASSHRAKPATASASLAADAVTELLRKGILAPSGGNCQPWQFRLNGDSIDCIHDVARSESFLDLNHQASYMAFGSLLENMQIAGGAAGIEVTPELILDGETFCRLQLTPTPTRSSALEPCIEERATNRRLGEGLHLPQETRDMLMQAADSCGASLRLVEGKDELRELGSILGAGDRLRFLHKTMHQEMMGEIRWSSADAETTLDGIDIGTLELSAADLAGMRLLRSWPAMKTIASFGGGVALEKISKKAVDHSSALGVLTVRGNDPASFFQGGRALQRVWLTSTLCKLAFQPMTAINYLFPRLDMPQKDSGLPKKAFAQLQALQQRYANILPLPDGDSEIMLFRLSFAEPPSVRALRRNLEDCIQQPV